MAETASASHPFGINLIGHFASNTGLGGTARALAGLLRAKKVPFLIYDLPAACDNPHSDPSFADLRVDRIEDLCHPLNLYVLPACGIHALVSAYPALFTAERWHIANIWWEASRFPSHWLEVLARFDGLLAMSEFVAEICRNSLPLTPTLLGEHPLELPENILPDRDKFGFPEAAVVFVASLDVISDPVRKNPAALITAFRAAFPESDQEVRLVIRLNNAATEVGRKVVQRLRQLARGDGRISLLLEPLSYEEVLSLYASADVYLSCHRGEGLGLGLLEAMRLGKAVIATGWSGNLGFMTHSNSALLRYRLVPVNGVYPFFRPESIGADARWAEPEIGDAVAWMQRLRHDQARRKSLGEKAKLAALAYQCRAKEARWLRELKDLWQAHQHLPGLSGKWSGGGETGG